MFPIFEPLEAWYAGPGCGSEWCGEARFGALRLVVAGEAMSCRGRLRFGWVTWVGCMLGEQLGNHCPEKRRFEPVPIQSFQANRLVIFQGNNMSTKIDDEFAFLDLPAGGVDLDEAPVADSDGRLNPSDFWCAEAAMIPGDRYIPCGAKAVNFVNNRDRKAYPMCAGCTSHNVKNRGGKIVHPANRDEIMDASEVMASFASVPTKFPDEPKPLEIIDENANSIMNPLTMSLVDLTDIDSLIHACVDAKQQLDDLRSFEDTIRRKLGEFAKGEAKTRRVRGRTLRAKLEMPDEGWDQTILKEAWQSYEKFRDGYLGIGTISVKKREFNKLAEMSTDDPAFRQFKSMLEASVRPATGAPRVSLEK